MAGSPPRSRPRRTSAQTREHVLAVAAESFYRDGIRATGIDTVAARAGVAPPTLYRLFATKDDLVAAYVARCSADYRDRVNAVTSPDAGSARHRLVALFVLFTADATSEHCRGCPFQLVLAEFPDPGHPAHREAVAHKAWVRDVIRALVDELSADHDIADPAGLTAQLTVSAEGIYGAAQTLGGAGPAQHGRACAEALIGFATSGSR